MAYDPIQRLREGNVDFWLRGGYTTYDTKAIITRIRALPDKNEVIRAFLPKVIKYMPYSSFEIIYDNDEFKDETKKILSSKYKSLLDISTEKLNNIINRTSWGENYIFRRLDFFLSTDEIERMIILVTFIYEKSTTRTKWIDKFIKNKDMHKRALFLDMLIQLYPKEAEKILKNFSNIVEYKPRIGEQLSFFPPRINDVDLSKIVVDCLHSDIDKSIFVKMKEYLLTNYKKNDVATLLLLSNSVKHKTLNMETFASDADNLFLASRTGTYHILTQYTNLISKKVLEKYNNILKLEEAMKQGRRCISSPLYVIYAHELGEQLIRIIDKYLSMSKSSEITFLGAGTKCCSFQLGDYSLKLGSGKWSYEEIICPNLYLILKNLEEYYIRNQDRIVVANMEVQPYLRKKAIGIPEKHFKLFHQNLHDLGYYTSDPRASGTTGENFGILDSYKDADCRDPEQLPDEFKKIPLVLYDRDLVFRLDNHKQKVLTGSLPY